MASDATQFQPPVPVLVVDRIFGVLLLASVLLLNAGPMLEAGWDGTGTGVARGPIYLAWLVAPAVLWASGVVNFLRAKKDAYWVVCSLWVVLLAAHGLVALAYGGPRIAIASVMSWGVWFGGFLWLSYSPGGRLSSRLIMAIVLGIGVAQGVLVTYEWLVGQPLLREASVGDIVRRYGVSQAISVTGVQISAGGFAALFFGTRARSTFSRSSFHILASAQWLALLLVTARGPLLFSAVGLIVASWYAFRFGGGFIARHVAVVGALVLCASAVFAARQREVPDLARFVIQALTTGDESNASRFGIWAAAWREVTAAPASFLIGQGAGTSVTIPHLLDQLSTTTESSLLKLWLETGMVGFCVFGLLVCAPLAALARARSPAMTPDNKLAIAPLSAVAGMIVMVLLEGAIHDMLMAWVITFYLWMGLAVLHSTLQSPLERRGAV